MTLLSKDLQGTINPSTLFLYKKAMASSRKYQGFPLVFWLLGITWWIWIPQGATCFSVRFKENPRMKFGWRGQRFPSNRCHKWSGHKIQMCDPKVNHSPALASSSRDASISKEPGDNNERNFIIWFLVVFFFGHPSSAVFGFIMLKVWTSLGSCSLRLGQLCRFAWRGAGASFLSVFLSLVGIVGIAALWPTPSPFVGFALLLVGAGAEEFSKFIALIWLSWSSAKVWQRNPESDWPKNPRVLMIAGLCVGVGFMVIENKLKVNFEWQRLHIISQELLRPRHLDFNWPVVWGHFMGMFIRDVVICNTHPYYCGIAAGQFASSVSKKSLTILDWLRILWLPSVLHFTHNVCGFADLKGLRWTVDVLTFLLFVCLWRKKGQQK